MIKQIVMRIMEYEKKQIATDLPAVTGVIEAG